MRKPKIDKPELKEDILLPFSEVEFFNKWQQWLLFRKQSRYPAYVAIGLNQTFRKLKQDSGDNVVVAMAIIDQSIANNWRGLFPLKNNFNGKQQPITGSELRTAVDRLDDF